MSHQINVVPLIKALRTYTSYGLKEAKDIVDSWRIRQVASETDILCLLVDAVLKARGDDALRDAKVEQYKEQYRLADVARQEAVLQVAAKDNKIRELYDRLQDAGSPLAQLREENKRLEDEAWAAAGRLAEQRKVYEDIISLMVKSMR